MYREVGRTLSREKKKSIIQLVHTESIGLGQRIKLTVALLQDEPSLELLNCVSVSDARERTTIETIVLRLAYRGCTAALEETAALVSRDYNAYPATLALLRTFTYSDAEIRKALDSLPDVIPTGQLDSPHRTEQVGQIFHSLSTAEIDILHTRVGEELAGTLSPSEMDEVRVMEYFEQDAGDWLSRNIPLYPYIIADEVIRIGDSRIAQAETYGPTFTSLEVIKHEADSIRTYLFNMRSCGPKRALQESVYNSKCDPKFATAVVQIIADYLQFPILDAYLYAMYLNGNQARQDIYVDGELNETACLKLIRQHLSRRDFNLSLHWAGFIIAHLENENSEVILFYMALALALNGRTTLAAQFMEKCRLRNPSQAQIMQGIETIQYHRNSGHLTEGVAEVLVSILDN